MIPVYPLLNSKMKTILLPFPVMLLIEVEIEGTTGDMKEEGMILELISLNLRDSLILMYSCTGSKLWRKVLNSSRSQVKRRLN